MIRWVELLRAAGEVERCHTVPTLRRYNVAEHSFNAMAIALELCQRNPEADELSVMKYLLTHDAPEVYTGDIPANVKVDSPYIKSNLQSMEDSWYAGNQPTHYPITLTQVERRVAKVSDTLELLYFCVEEIEFGNRRRAMLQMTENAYSYLKTEGIAGVSDFMDEINRRCSVSGVEISCISNGVVL